MTCASCTNGSCPEVPTAISVENTNIQYNGANATWREEVFAGSDGANSNTIFQLSFYPVEDQVVSVFLNSGLQRQGIDYTIDGYFIAMTTALLDEDVLVVRYLSYEAQISTVNVAALGHIFWQADTSVPSGYCAADATTVYTIADFPALYAYCSGNSLIFAETATTFTIVDLSIGPTGGGLTLNAVLKN